MPFWKKSKGKAVYKSTAQNERSVDTYDESAQASSSSTTKVRAHKESTLCAMRDSRATLLIRSGHGCRTTRPNRTMESQDSNLSSPRNKPFLVLRSKARPRKRSRSTSSRSTGSTATCGRHGNMKMARFGRATSYPSVYQDLASGRTGTLRTSLPECTTVLCGTTHEDCLHKLSLALK
jgi:hypothetical protein